MSSNHPVAIITGAAGGIGQCLAQGFAEQGYQVCALDIEKMGFSHPLIKSYLVDLRDKQQIKQCFADMAQEWAAPQVLINCAAQSHYHCSIKELEPERFEELISINLCAAFACAKYFVQHHLGRYGRIINISSTRYHQNESDWEAYGASKGGLVSLSNSLCVSLSNTGITVNTISPGWIQTTDYEKLSISDHQQHPSGRVGTPQDILRACLFLCERDNDFINGANLIIDGGMTKRMIYVD